MRLASDSTIALINERERRRRGHREAEGEVCEGDADRDHREGQLGDGFGQREHPPDRTDGRRRRRRHEEPVEPGAEAADVARSQGEPENHGEHAGGQKHRQPVPLRQPAPRDFGEQETDQDQAQPQGQAHVGQGAHPVSFAKPGLELRVEPQPGKARVDLARERRIEAMPALTGKLHPADSSDAPRRFGSKPGRGAGWTVMLTQPEARPQPRVHAGRLRRQSPALWL